MAFVIVADKTRKVSGGKLVEEAFFYVADDATDSIVSKSFGSQEDAEAHLATLKGLEEGMEFANATFPDMSDKARVGKANVVAEYLAWVAAGKPVKEATGVAQADEPVEDVSAEETF